MKSAGPAIASPGGGAALRLGSQNSSAARISATPITSAIRAITLMELGAGMGLPRCRRRGRSVKQSGCLEVTSRNRAVRGDWPREGLSHGTGSVPVFATLAIRLGIPERSERPEMKSAGLE